MKKEVVISVFILLVCISALAQADTTWVRRYNGPSNSSDLATAITVDNSGNIYVTGHSSGSGTGYDCATIKYYPNGDIAWTRRYSGPGNGEDSPKDIAIDGLGYVYVTGHSFSSGTSSDYVTIKYSPSGDTIWVRKYNGEGNEWDEARGIVIDSGGNVYITGYSGGSETGNDYATVKYGANGNEIWVRRYNGPANDLDVASSIAIDNFGNVYVTGSSCSGGTNNDYTTIKYDQDGNELWVRRYDGSGVDWDEPFAIAIDGSYNILVTGLITGSGTSYDFATIKYYPNGDTAWVRIYSRPGYTNDWAVDLAIDNLNNIYVTGTSWDSGTGFDYTTIKYDPDGNEIWVRKFNGSSNDDDYASAIAVDRSGNVHVTGYSGGSGTESDYATIKYDSDGNLLLVERYDGPINSEDVARTIAVDGSSNIYVTGYSYGNGTERDYTTIKYSQFLRGDANADGKVSVSDIVYLVNYLFKGGPPPAPIQRGDANCDSKVTVADVVYIVNYLFKGGKPPCS